MMYREINRYMKDLVCYLSDLFFFVYNIFFTNATNMVL